jgi:hypothetical protein
LVKNKGEGKYTSKQKPQVFKCSSLGGAQTSDSLSESPPLSQALKICGPSPH